MSSRDCDHIIGLEDQTFSIVTGLTRPGEYVDNRGIYKVVRIRDKYKETRAHSFKPFEYCPQCGKKLNTSKKALHLRKEMTFGFSKSGFKRRNGV